MRHFRILLFIVSLMTIIPSCKKDKKSNTECFPGSTTVRQITEGPAVVKEVNTRFFIIEKGSIDTKLNPCPFPDKFKVDNLEVIISGEVKAAAQAGPGPCCGQDFALTRIKKK